MRRGPEANRDPDFFTAQAFAGACVLTGALLLPHVEPGPVLAGMALAGVLRWAWHCWRRRRGVE